jgi:TPR repeat protein
MGYDIFKWMTEFMSSFSPPKPSDLIDNQELLNELRVAAEQGEAEAQYYQGYIFYSGEDIPYGQSVPKNYKLAHSWFRKAAEQGVSEAQSILGFMYENGEGVPKDDVQAVSWYHKAAEQGNIEAQFNLGKKYAKGKGVPKDNVQAYAWLIIAEANGDEDAASLMDNLRWWMTSPQT